MRDKYVVIVAAGRGSRMGLDIPKQFLKINGKAILQLTIERFLKACPDIKVVLALAKEYIPYWKNYCYENKFDCPQILSPGGITRFHSVRNALDRIPNGAKVAIHDGVRPFASVELIRKMFKSNDYCKASVPVLPSVDTLIPLQKVDICSIEERNEELQKLAQYSDEKLIHDNLKKIEFSGECLEKETIASLPDLEKVEQKKNNFEGLRKLSKDNLLQIIPGEEIDRSIVYAVQTPQVFHTEVIKDAYATAYDTSFTDDASVARSVGVRVEYLEGERYNIKITTQDDLKLANLLINLL